MSPLVRPADMLDMAVVALLIYALLVWFKKTRTAFVVQGLLVIIGVYVMARVMEMYMTTLIFKGFFAIFIIAVVVIFQEELRSIFERIAVWSIARPRQQAAPQEPDILARALSDLARDKVGALIVMRGRDPLDRHLEGGWDLHGELSEALIESIFDSHSLGHDGAMIIEDGRVTKFGVHLPLSKDFSKITHMGLRHTAALGLCERTDALCLAVSQERGVISVGRRAQLTTIDNLQDLHRILKEFLMEIAPRTPRQGFLAFLTHNTREKAVALVVSALLWWLFIGNSLRP
ncbi:MAG: DNA integrity scanning protein DisA nucleotide-binding domain protein [Elusimicrobia bacterium]|nr:DNA integrity scanning protein DisA nucleotide-binding domain protein [Elusimicrobiota bacterium]